MKQFRAVGSLYGMLRESHVGGRGLAVFSLAWNFMPVFFYFLQYFQFKFNFYSTLISFLCVRRLLINLSTAIQDIWTALFSLAYSYLGCDFVTIKMAVFSVTFVVLYF